MTPRPAPARRRGVATVVLAALFLAAAGASLAAGPGQRRVPPKFRRKAPARAKARGSVLPPILRKVVLAARTLRYSGVRTVDQRVRGDLVRHTEYVLRDGPRVRISFSSEARFAGQVIVDDGRTRKRFNPRTNQIELQPSQRDDALNRLVGANNRILSPRVTLGDGGQVAGVRTVLANIYTAKGEVVQQLFVDPATGAVLKRVGYDKTGSIVANYEFTSIDYAPAIARDAFVLANAGARIVTPESVVRRQALRADVPAVLLPPKSKFRLFNSRIVVRENVKVLQEVYLGASGRLSMFVLRAPIDPALLAKRGGPRIHVYAFQNEGVSVVFVGPYAEAELKKLSGEVVPR